MQAVKPGMELRLSGSQHGGGAGSQGAPNTPSSHCTWHSAIALVHLSVALITRLAKLAPALAIRFWQRATVAMSALAC